MGNVTPELQAAEHTRNENIQAKRVALYGWNAGAMEWVRLAVDSNGSITMSGYTQIQEEGSDVAQRTKLNFIGAALTAADNSGLARTDVTLSQSPSTSTSVVGTERTITAGTGLTGGGDLSANRTLSLDTPVLVASGGTGTTTSFTTGSVVFAGASGVYTQDNTNFFWDDTNNRLGILTASPASPLSVGSGSVFQVTSTGRCLGPDGSAANTAYSFTGQSGMGMFRVPTNTLAWATAGSERMRLTSGGLALLTQTLSYTFSIDGDSARTAGVIRHSTSNTAGNSFTINAGGATSGATDKNGGSLILVGGQSTGTGSSSVALQASISGATGTSDNTISTLLSIDGSTRRVNIKAGASNGTVALLGGTVYENTTDANNSGTGETTLWSQSIIANALGRDGQTLHFVYMGTIQTSVNNKQLKVKFGATTIFDSTAQNPLVATDWILEGWIWRTGSATQKTCVKLNTTGGNLFTFCQYATPAETLSGAINLDLTGQGGASNELTFKAGKIYWESDD